ncbi:MAG: FAD-dependent oxidoreductase [Acidobacteriota bacterium]
MEDIAIIGAGLSAVSCARRLREAGTSCRLFEKSRGPGGRLSTRRAGELRFDHGAQYFTARDSRFREQIEAWRAEGLAAPWQGRIVSIDHGQVSPTSTPIERYVGVPRMSVLSRALMGDIPIETGCRITALRRTTAGWVLSSEEGAQHGPFRQVVVSAPAPQAAELLEPAAELAAAARSARFAPCWAAMLAFEEPLPLNFDGAFVASSALSWIARNSSKPERPEAESWVLHGSSEWSTAHLEESPKEALEGLTSAFREAVQMELPEAVHAVAHRWRFALPETPLEDRCLYDATVGVGACGDWCGGPRVEGAYLSGWELADRLTLS